MAVGTTSQYILQALFSSGNLNDGKAAIPLLKGMDEHLSLSSLRYQTMDAGYRAGKRAKIHFDMVTLIYNASKLAADRINAQLMQQQAA